MKVTIIVPHNSSINLTELFNILNELENFSKSESLIFIIIKQTKNFVIYYSILRVERAHFYGSHNYRDLISKKLAAISNNYDINVNELNDIKRILTDLTQIVNVTTLVQIFSNGVGGKDVFINYELAVKGENFIDFILNNTSNFQSKYLSRIKLVIIRNRFSSYFQSNSDTHIQIINDLNKQQLIFNRIKEIQHKLNTPILNNWIKHNHLEFSKINRDNLLKEFNLDLQRYYSLLCLTHILILREGLFDLKDKSQSLHISGRPRTGKSSLINKIISIFGSDIFYFVGARNIIDFTNYEPTHRPVLIFDDNLGKESRKYLKLPEHYTFLKKALGSDRRFFAIRKYKESVQVCPLPAVILSNYSYLFIRDSAIKSRLKVVNFSRTNPIFWSNLRDENFKKIIFYTSIEVACYYSQSDKRATSLNCWTTNLHYGSYNSWKRIKLLKYQVDKNIFRIKI